MSYQDEIAQLARRLRRFMPLPGAVAAAAYFLTLSRDTVPGVSAALSAAAAGLNPPTEASHPLFACASRLAAAPEIFSLPTRLNLFSALCGALSAMLFYHLVSRLVLFSACRDAGGGKQDGARRRRGAAPAESDAPPPASPLRTPRIYRVAVSSGLLAAALLIFSAPLWSAATHLDRGPFDLLLALSAISLFPITRTAWRTPRLLASATLFACGLLESPVFLLLLPAYALALLKVALATRRRLVLLGQLAFAGLAGLTIMLAAYRFNSESAAPLSGSELFAAFAHAAPSCLYWEAKAFFPASGWAVSLMQVGLAALLVLFGRKALFFARRRDTAVVLVLLALATLPGLLLLPVAPYCVFAPAGRLPVFAHAVLALGAAAAFASCLIALINDKRQPASEQPPSAAKKGAALDNNLSRVKLLAKCLIPALLLTALASPLRSYPSLRAGRGAFADAIARELLDQMKGRECLATNGALDNNLHLLAAARKQPLMLVSLRPGAALQEQARLQTVVAASPLFVDGIRLRLQNALSITPMRFLSEWLSVDTNAYRHILIDAAPDLWTAGGFRAMPEGLAFGGISANEKPDLAQLLAQNARFAARIAPLLSAGPHDPRSPFEPLRLSLCGRAGSIANELGVLLEELGEHQAAYQAYTNALSVDPKNVSAAINACALAVAKDLEPATHDQLKKRIKGLLSDRRVASLGLVGIVQRYGTVRHPAFYQQQALRWKSAGTEAVAASNMRKALDLVDQAGRASLVEKAYFYEQMGDAAKAEELYKAALADSASNRDAFLGLCRLALERREAAQAADWLQKASSAGAAPADLRAPAIDLALLKAELPVARKLLEEATQQQPESPRYWGQLAEVMVKQGDSLQVKQSLLPEMAKKLKPPFHYLVYSIRGTLLIQSGQSSVKDGRLDLLKSLSMNAAQPNVWNSVLTSDMVINNLSFTEADARSLLSLEPDHALANYLMGSVLLAKGKLQEAEDFFRRSLAKKPTASACNDLAEALRLLKRPQEAEAFARQALALDDGLFTAHDTLANALYDLGRLEEAASEARAACAADPGTPAHQLTLLRVLIRLGDAEAAKAHVQALDKAKIAIPSELRDQLRQMK